MFKMQLLLIVVYIMDLYAEYFAIFWLVVYSDRVRWRWQMVWWTVDWLTNGPQLHVVWTLWVCFLHEHTSRSWASPAELDLWVSSGRVRGSEEAGSDGSTNTRGRYRCQDYNSAHSSFVFMLIILLDSLSVHLFPFYFFTSHFSFSLF